MPVLVLPSHGLLDGIMKLSKGRLGWNREATPDFRFNLVEKNFYEVAHGIARAMSLPP